MSLQPAASTEQRVSVAELLARSRRTKVCTGGLMTIPIEPEQQARISAISHSWVGAVRTVRTANPASTVRPTSHRGASARHNPVAMPSGAMARAAANALPALQD
jgi:hypothetical protein